MSFAERSICLKLRDLAMVAGAVMFVAVLPASASTGPCSGEGVARDGGVGAGADCPTAPADPTPGDTSSPTPTSDGPECTEERRNDPAFWFRAYNADWSNVDIQAEVNLLMSDREEGQVVAIMRDCAGNDRGAPFWADPPPEGQEDDFDAVLAARDRAFANLDLSPPQVDIAPPDGGVLAGLPAWLSTDQEWVELTDADATAGGITVEVYAEPTQLTWSTPEGDQVCGGPGIPWSRAAWDQYQASPADSRGQGNPACTFVFTSASGDTPYDTTVTVTWSVGWSFNGGPRIELPALDLTSDVPVDVGERRAVRTR